MRKNLNYIEVFFCLSLRKSAVMLKKIGLGLLLFLALLAIGFFIYAQGKKPQLKGSVDLVGLTDEAVVYFDDYGVP